MGPINSLSSNYVQSVLDTVLKNSGIASNTSKTTGSGGILPPTDKSQLSPFAQLVSTLQQLLQSDPAKYQAVTQQISLNLKSAAQTAQASGNSTAANQLNQLATDFFAASKSGQIPNLQDLAQAVGGHHHHHHSHSSSGGSDGSSINNTNQTINKQLLALPPSAPPSGPLTLPPSTPPSGLLNLPPSEPPSGPLSPLAIIQKTLAGAGFPGFNS